MKIHGSSCLLKLFSFIFCLFLQTHISYGADTISGHQSLSGDQTIISKGGLFELGFFQPGNASKYYIGIWYKKLSPKTTVWVANRDIPVSDKYGSHVRIQDNNLVLLNEAQVSVWSTNLNSTSSGPLVATLLDEGNFVLSDGPFVINFTIPIWQSFDNPTDTWLPGGKISYNKITRTKQLLISWKNSEDPAPGLFSLELVPTEKTYVIRWNRSIQYWSSGNWNGRIFSLVPEMSLNYYYNFSYIDNANESYFTYTVYHPSVVTSRLLMDVSGQIKQFTLLDNTKQWNLFWTQPRQQCQVYAYCGAFSTCNQNSLPSCDCLPHFHHKSDADWNLNDFSGGCTRNTTLHCTNGNSTNAKKDRFLVQNQLILPDEFQSVHVGSERECENTCLSNCACSAYAFDSSGCSIFKGELLNLQRPSAGDGSGKTINIRLAASEVSNGKSNKGVVITAVLVSVAVALVVLGVILFLICRHEKRVARTGNSTNGSLVAFTYRDLQHATKNFSENLGRGGFGSVFKGTLPESSVIAVKKLESISQGEKQFRAEVSTIGTIQHVNLVRLRGFCSEGDNKLLVYDYMENSSLDSHLFHDKDSKVLDWKLRYQIALGTARGLTYLHEKCRDCIIHCDIKPENILLDADFCPKVADFGLAKLMGRDFSRVLTTMRGTRGYLAPEWISGVAITPKADVYSYGMMLFEMISGKRNSEHSLEGLVKFFPTWAAKVIAEGGDVLTLLDPKLDRTAGAEEVSRLCKIACWCIQDDENHRPTMGQVVQILEGVLEVNLPPVPRSLQVFIDSQDHIVFFTESSSNPSSQTQSKTSSDTSNTKSSATSSQGLQI